MQYQFLASPGLLVPAVTQFNNVWLANTVADNQMVVAAVVASPLNANDGTNAVASLQITKQRAVFNSYNQTIDLQPDVTVRKERVARASLADAVLHSTLVASGGYQTVQAASITSGSTGVLSPTQYTDLITGLSYGGIFVDASDIVATANGGMVTITAAPLSLGWVGAVTVGLNPSTSTPTVTPQNTARQAMLAKINAWISVLTVENEDALGYDISAINEKGNNTLLKLYSTQRSVAVRYVRTALKGTLDLTKATAIDGNSTLADILPLIVSGVLAANTSNTTAIPAAYPTLTQVDLATAATTHSAGGSLVITAAPGSVHFTGSLVVLVPPVPA